MRSVRPAFVVVLASLATTSACSFMLAAMKPVAATPVVVDNPLTSGQPLEHTEKGDVGGVAEADCNTWPFEDKVSVTVTEAKICVEIHKHKASSATWVGEPTANSSEGVQVSNDAGAGPYINANKTHSSKVGSCFNKGFNENTPIWAFDYKGCEPNNGTVTAATKSLSAAHQAWTFPAGAPAGSGSAAPTTTAM